MDTVRLANLIDRKHEVLRQLLLLAQRQYQVVNQGEMGTLISILAAKQRMLNELQTVETELAPFREQDPESRRWCAAGERQRVRGVAGQCEAILREIVRLESHCEQELVNRRDAAAARLQGTHSAAQAVQSYANLNVHHSSGLDVSSET